MSSPAAPPTVKLAEVKPMTLRDHVINILRLVVKELRSIRADPTMLILVAYAFSISVNTVATGAVSQPGVGLDGQQQSVVAQQRTREGVVGADHRSARRFGVRPAGGQVQTDAGQPAQPGPNPAQQLTGGLAGERQPQHLARLRVAVGDEPHHSRGHRLGLACAGAGDDDQRPRRRGDDGRLLGGRREKPQGAC